MSEPIIRGGQIWRQEKFPCFTVYITMLANGWMAMLTDPSEHGSMQIVRDVGETASLPAADMEAHLVGRGYSLVGSYADLRKAELEATYQAGREAK